MMLNYEDDAKPRKSKLESRGPLVRPPPTKLLSWEDVQADHHLQCREQKVQELAQLLSLFRCTSNLLPSRFVVFTDLVRSISLPVTFDVLPTRSRE